MKILKFHADWCGPCKAFAPTIEKVAEAKGVDVESIDISDEENQLLMQEHNIRAVPTIVLLHQGHAVKQNTGQMSENDLKEWLTLDEE